MSVVESCRVEPVVIESSSGPLFGVFYPPAAPHANAMVLFVPPFAEEMNRARRMAALQARDFAARGIGTLIFDPFGTGDSTGEFHEARLAVWLDNLVAAADWLGGRG